jgi:putative CocE/NonD family hydrolase
MHWRTLLFIAALGAAASAPQQARAQAAPFVNWDETKLSPPAYKVRTEHNVRIPMRDGVTLSADIYRPDSGERFPALLLRTPYSNNAPDEIQNSAWFAARGYVVVNEDVRGRYDSDGEFYPFRHEADDGYDTDEWIAQQPWSNGRVGTMGGSYLGYTQLTQGVRASSHLLAMSADFTSSDIHDGWVYVDGAFLLGFALPWGAATIDGHINQGGEYDWPSVFLHLPLATADAAAGHVNRPYRDWLLHPRRDDPYWNGISFEREARSIATPLLVVQGWYDIFLRGALRDDIAIRQGSAPESAALRKRLIIGPWVHSKAGGSRISDPSLPKSGLNRSIDFGADAEVEWRRIYLRWHDYWLKGIDNGVASEPPISLFVMGENRWRHENEWPLARTRYARYYVQSGGRANGAAGDGTLSTRPPMGATSDAYTYDPASPVPTLGGNLCCSSVPNGPRDHRPVEARADVLVYTTPVLAEAVEVTGPITMKLYAATTAKDTDWVARLVDVHPDGFAQNIQDGIIRARYRAGRVQPASLLEPGKIYEYDIDMWATSNVFLPGHRLRLEITSSNFPRFDRNLNTGEDPATGTRMQTARQTIYHSARYPSHVVLPIIPRPRADARR